MPPKVIRAPSFMFDEEEEAEDLDAEESIEDADNEEAIPEPPKSEPKKIPPRRGQAMLPDVVFPPEPEGDYIASVFGQGGYLSKGKAHYEERPGQIALARHVEAILRGEEHGLAEGPCGTGKGIAYAVPAVFHAHFHGKKTVIVTANLALQDQLITKDLPELRRALPWEFAFTSLKGRSNYFCMQKYLTEEENGTIGDASDAVRQAAAWGSGILTTEEIREEREDGVVPESLVEPLDPDDIRGMLESEAPRVRLRVIGDRRELSKSLTNKEWGLMSTNSEECLAESCPCLAKGMCHYAVARGKCHDANITVANMHVLGAHMSVRKMTGMDLVLPPHDIVIVDEAHELGESIREFFGFSLSDKTMQSFAQKLDKTSFVQGPRGSRQDLGKPLVDKLRRASHSFFSDVATYANGKRVKLENSFMMEAKIGTDDILGVLEEIKDLAAEFEEQAAEKEQDNINAFYEDEDTSKASKYRKIKDRAEAIQTYVSECVGQDESENKVYWVDFPPWDKRKVSPRLEARPIETGGIINGELFQKTTSVILVSATLTTTPGNFRFMRGELGVPKDASELAVPSPFDTGNQILVVVPGRGTLPAPSDPHWADKALKYIQEVVDVSDGRTLGLFTSYKMLEEATKKIRSQHPILFQERDGGMNRNELVDAFKRDTPSSLFGTASFWTGIDVVGESLTTVVIDKIPFEHQDDPIVEALKDKYAANASEDDDTNKFWSWYTNRALLKLRQGVGRLIRSQDDVGAVVILDRRIAMKHYGKSMVQSLGPIKKSNKISDIAEHLRTAREYVLANRTAFMERQRKLKMEPRRPAKTAAGGGAKTVKVPKGVF